MSDLIEHVPGKDLINYIKKERTILEAWEQLVQKNQHLYPGTYNEVVKEIDIKKKVLNWLESRA
jgi:hypothetical protein